MTDPTDPLTELQQGAAQLHEYFESLKAAGFSPEESLRLVTAVLTSSIGGTS